MKGTLLLAGFGVVALELVRCGSSACDSANSMLTTCATHIPMASTSASSAASGGGVVFDPTSCDGASACKANCVVSFTCAQINGNDPHYTTCLVECNGK